jgi:hypothetical protein
MLPERPRNLSLSFRKASSSCALSNKVQTKSFRSCRHALEYPRWLGHLPAITTQSWLSLVTFDRKSRSRSPTFWAVSLPHRIQSVPSRSPGKSDSLRDTSLVHRSSRWEHHDARHDIPWSRSFLYGVPPRLSDGLAQSL